MRSSPPNLAIWARLSIHSHLGRVYGPNLEYNLGMGMAWRKVSRTGLAYLWSILIWASFGPVMAGQEKLRLLAGGSDVPYWNLLLITGAWCMTAALLTPPVFYVVRRWPIARPFQLGRFASYLFGAIPYLVISMCLRSVLLPPGDPATQDHISRFLEGVRSNAKFFALQTWDYLMILVGAHAYEYFMRARNEELERAKLQQALAESELQALKSQLQPHFLFNTLHGISSLIEVDRPLARAMVLKLSSLLRTVLQSGTADLVSLEEELSFAEAYLDIEKMRLSGRLEIRWTIPPDTGQILVPRLILQPLVENAIAHGVACSREGGWLEIRLKRAEDYVELSVRNSVRGKGAPGSGLGLQNTRARLNYLYGDEARLVFAVDEVGIATATVRMPALAAAKPELGAEVAAPVRSAAR